MSENELMIPRAADLQVFDQLKAQLKVQLDEANAKAQQLEDQIAQLRSTTQPGTRSDSMVRR